MWLAESMLFYQPVCLLCCWSPFSCYFCICSEDWWHGKLSILCNSDMIYFSGSSLIFFDYAIMLQGLWLGIICAMAVQILALVVMMLQTNWDEEVHP